jgi:hypothetical protein
VAWDRELEVLEEAIRRLGAEYDAFLYGTATRPPVESRKHVEQMIRRLSGVSFDVAAERYRFATLQGRYTTLTERWERLQGEKESGRRPGLYGHFVPGGERPHGAGGGPAAPAPLKTPNAAGSGSVEGPGASAGADRHLFETYLGARRARGESVEGYDFQKFAESLARERARLRERLGTEDVVFEVAEREGKVKLIAKRAAAEGGAPLEGKK